MIDNLVATNILEAYRSGLLQRTASSCRQHTFGSLLQATVSRRIGLRERLVLRKVWQGSGKGLVFVEQGHLAEARSHFSQARDLLGSTPATSECRLLARSVLEAAEAYLDYKSCDFPQARTRVYVSMDADLELELIYSYDLLQVHRLQSAHNLIRIDFREGAFERAFCIAGGILAYLSGLAPAVPLHYAWCARTLAECPRYLLSALADQVTQDVAIALEKFTDAVCWKSFRHFAAIDHLRLDQPVPGSGTLEWIALKEAFLAGDYKGYLLKVPRFLAKGRSGNPALWYSSILDVLEICGISGDQTTSAASCLRAAILRDSSSWTQLPLGLAPRLKRYRQVLESVEGSRRVGHEAIASDSPATR